VAKGGGVKASGKSAGSGAPTEQGILNMIKLHSDGSGRAVIAEMRDVLPGTRDQQDALMLKMQVEGKIILYRSDNNSDPKKWRGGGVRMPGVEPRVFAYKA